MLEEPACVCPHLRTPETRYTRRTNSLLRHVCAAATIGNWTFVSQTTDERSARPTGQCRRDAFRRRFSIRAKGVERWGGVQGCFDGCGVPSKSRLAGIFDGPACWWNASLLACTGPLSWRLDACNVTPWSKFFDEPRRAPTVERALRRVFGGMQRRPRLDRPRPRKVG